MVDLGIIRFPYYTSSNSGALIESLDADRLDQSILAAWNDRPRMKWDSKGLSRLIQLLELGSKRKRCTKLKMRIYESVSKSKLRVTRSLCQSTDAHRD